MKTFNLIIMKHTSQNLNFESIYSLYNIYLSLSIALKSLVFSLMKISFLLLLLIMTYLSCSFYTFFFLTHHHQKKKKKILLKIKKKVGWINRKWKYSYRYSYTPIHRLIFAFWINYLNPWLKKKKKLPLHSLSLKHFDGIIF